GGCNAVRNMYNEGVEGVTFAICNTDSQALFRSPVPVKIQLGASGLGAGANPEVGRTEAEYNVDDIRRLLDDGTKMVFVTAGMGGGTGTGAAPVIAGIAKEKGILTVGVATIPFYFEKKKKIIKALKGVEELRKNVDALLIINNERLCDIYADSDVTVKEAFQRADNILKDAVKGISELITVYSDGGINLDFRDVETTMKNGGGAIMAMGRASGEHRVEKAIINALDSPLLYGNDIGKAKRILFNIYASEEAPIFVREMQEIDDFFDLLDPNIDVIWGTAIDDSLGEDAKVTILATGLEEELHTQESKVLGDDDYFEQLIPKLYRPVKKAARQITTNKEEAPTKETVSPTEVEVKVEVAEPKEISEPAPSDDVSPKKENPTMVERWRSWMINKFEEYTQES
ncbi:MAG: cell division protein FtsZ, partial [Prevotella sp.]|nr:cell division protein FtsZ [Prevotella sp.]